MASASAVVNVNVRRDRSCPGSYLYEVRYVWWAPGGSRTRILASGSAEPGPDASGVAAVTAAVLRAVAVGLADAAGA